MSSMLRVCSLLLVPLAACVGEVGDPASLGEAEVALASVPSGVQCIHVDVAGGGVVAGHSFAVSAGTAPVTLALGALPTGAVQFTGTAFDAACPDLVSAPAGVPSWIAEPIGAQLVPGLPAAIAFEFRRNLPGSGTAEFVDSALTIAPSSTTALALMADGTLRGWGSAYAGELGNNKLTDTQLAPVAAGLGLVDLEGVATTYYRGCAWRGAQLWCWGSNASGGLGDGTTIPSRLVPTAIPGAWGDIADVQLGGATGCLLANDTRAWCWGSNSYGQVGRPTTTASFNTPQEQPSRYEAIAVGGYTTCAISTSGTVECWGLNNTHQLGDGSADLQSATPRVTSVRAAVSVAVSGYHACAARADGTVWCWGSNSVGQLGAAGVSGATPSQVPGIADAIAVAVTADASCALRRDGTALCWGQNSTGALGTGTGVSTSSPSPVLGLSGAVDLRGNPNGGTFCATLADGDGRCWGTGTLGQIGDGGKSHRFVPTRVEF